MERGKLLPSPLRLRASAVSKIMNIPHIIAEAGTNHGGNLDKAKELVDVAVAAGADSVKFQIIYPEGLYLLKLREHGEWVDNAVVKARRGAMLSDDDYRALAAYCLEKQIAFSASIFDRRGLDLLCELEVPYIKIASTDCNNYPLLAQVAERRRPIILATGMATLGEVERAVKTIIDAGNNQLTLLHCVSVYPCPTEGMNLSFLTTLQQAFGFPVGLSDHTEQSLAAAVAVALGAAWFEKHFTYDRKAQGFDHAYAMEPEQLRSYIADVRAVSAALDRPALKVGERESVTKSRARRALYAARDLRAGETITEHDVQIVRPEGPLAPGDLGLIVGRKLKQPIATYEPFTLAVFE